MNGGSSGRADGAGTSSGSWAARVAASASQGRGAGASPELPPRSSAAPRTAVINQLVTFLPTSQGVDVPSPSNTTSSIPTFDAEFPPLPGRRQEQPPAERWRSLATLAPALGIRAAAAPGGGALSVTEPPAATATQEAVFASTLPPPAPRFGQIAPAGMSSRTPPVTGSGSAYSELSDGFSPVSTRRPLPATPPPRRYAPLPRVRQQSGATNGERTYSTASLQSGQLRPGRDGDPAGTISISLSPCGSATSSSPGATATFGADALSPNELTPCAQPGAKLTSQNRVAARIVTRSPVFVRQGLQTVVGPSLQSRLEALGATRVRPGAIAAAFGAAPNDLSITLAPRQALPAKRRATPTKRTKKPPARKAAKTTNCATPATSMGIVSATLAGEGPTAAATPVAATTGVVGPLTGVAAGAPAPVSVGHVRNMTAEDQEAARVMAAMAGRSQGAAMGIAPAAATEALSSAITNAVVAGLQPIKGNIATLSGHMDCLQSSMGRIASKVNNLGTSNERTALAVSRIQNALATATPARPRAPAVVGDGAQPLPRSEEDLAAKNEKDVTAIREACKAVLEPLMLRATNSDDVLPSNGRTLEIQLAATKSTLGFTDDTDAKAYLLSVRPFFSRLESGGGVRRCRVLERVNRVKSRILEDFKKYSLPAYFETLGVHQDQLSQRDAMTLLFEDAIWKGLSVTAAIDGVEAIFLRSGYADRVVEATAVGQTKVVHCARGHVALVLIFVQKVLEVIAGLRQPRRHGKMPPTYEVWRHRLGVGLQAAGERQGPRRSAAL
ncbi:hypothetical protein I4F81_007726 [Pyropia yezoensis]|uniref:Uncharacterized protein n=1 Tax=Pyropia yezoensis TaxID=2788 RepID=A0ACC3C4V1_PYRYE|nr:hypothetical protein I4F81_007726 [Neopyropia yezoensis]